MPSSRKIALLYAALISCVALIPSRSHAQWWTAPPADFEDCAERAEKSGASKDAKASSLSDCETKFAGRRKPGGGYTYHDFMQNRSFDIAGPNPTADEQKKIDEQYTVYLDHHRRSIIRAAFAEKQRQQEQVALETDRQPAAVPPRDTRSVATKTRAHARAPRCAIEPLTCGWSRLSAVIKDVRKTLFGPSAKTRRT